MGRPVWKGLADDMGLGRAKAEPGLRVVTSSDGGLFYNHILQKHDEYTECLLDLLDGAERLLNKGASKVGDTIDAMAKREQANLDEIKRLWEALEMEEGMEPVGPAPDGSVQANDMWWTSSLHQMFPGSVFDHWVFKILDWPSYMSVTGWLRRIINFLAFPFTGGRDLWEWLYSNLGGEWRLVEEAAFIWDLMGQFFVDLGTELETRMQIMFTGWYDSDAATTAGEYFREACSALASVNGPMSDLGDKYMAVATSSFGWCQAIYSGVDAIVDAVVAALLAGTSIAEILSGALALPGVVTAIIAVVKAVAAAWGYAMAAAYAMLGIGAGLGAVLKQVEWVTLPEG
uniref:hypothetical protein n=1 Tax=Tessaracoccus timonensis TaxID=2161816 RepID=UPI00131F2E90|nr:hypothetical protein [Tessaracoccus timonensis]